MASRITLNARNLEALGADRLAELLMEISEGNANARRRLRLELTGAESPDKLGNEIRKRLSAIGTATVNVGWRTLKGFRGDLATQRRLIVEQVAVSAPAEAAELMWQFIALGDGVIERTSDASGGVVAIFREACDDLARMMTAAAMTPDLARVVEAVAHNGYGQNDGLIAGLAPLLDGEGLGRLRTLVVGAGNSKVVAPVRPRLAKRGRKRLMAAAEALRRRPRAEAIRVALLALADAMGDVEAYIALQSDRRQPATAARIAQRLVSDGNPARALEVLAEARTGPHLAMPEDWYEARLAAFEALGQKEDAQALRLERFHQTLDARHLRAYLKRLPDFDDIEAEDEALDFARGFPDANVALAFLIAWPALDRAADVATRRASELDGHNAGELTFAADRLSSRYPLAALRLHRQIVEAALIAGSDKAQAAAVLPWLEAESLARHIDDFTPYESHEAWRDRLATLFARRRSFWAALPAPPKV